MNSQDHIADGIQAAANKYNGQPFETEWTAGTSLPAQQPDVRAQLEQIRSRRLPVSEPREETPPATFNYDKAAIRVIIVASVAAGGYAFVNGLIFIFSVIAAHPVISFAAVVVILFVGNVGGGVHRIETYKPPQQRGNINVTITNNVDIKG